MKRLGILTTLSEENSYSLARFKKEAKLMQVKLEPMFLAYTSLTISGKGNLLFHYQKNNFNLPTVILTRLGATDPSYGLYVLSQLCKLPELKIFNKIEGVSVARDKFRTLQLLAENNFLVPRSVILGKEIDLSWALKQVGGFPAIMKLNKGTFGIGVMLVESIGGAKSVFDTLDRLNQKIMIQEFVASEPGVDYRIMVVGGKVLAGMRRKAKVKGEFRSNIYQGGQGEKFKVPVELEKQAQDIATIVNLDIAGIDFVYNSKNGYLPIEVNANPDFQGLEKATGINVAKAIIEYCVK